MAHTFPMSSPSTLVRDARTGQFVEVRGVGALKGRLTLRREIDLTKPIFEQVSKTESDTVGKSKP